MNVREPGAATAGRFQTGTEAVWTLPVYGALLGVATFTQQPSPELPGIGSASAGAAAAWRPSAGSGWTASPSSSSEGSDALMASRTTERDSAVETGDVWTSARGRFRGLVGSGGGK